MECNEAGLALIKQFESCRLQAYQDQVGVWTLGWGATGSGIAPGVAWTQEQADNRLAADVARFSKGVDELLGVDVTDNQFSAMVCFAYNVGLGNLAKSHLLAKVNAQDFTGAADQFLRWDEADGAVIPGLLRRRTAERRLFLSA